MRRLLIALPALALLSGCGILFAEVEIPSTTITLEGQRFPGTVTPGPLTKDVNFDLGGKLTIITEKGVSFDLRLLRMEIALTATSPMGDFGDIESVTLAVLPPPGQTLPEATVIASYTRSPTDPNPRSISVAAMSNVNLAPYLVAGAMTLRITAVSRTGGIIPDWTADVGAEFYLKLHVDYFELATKK
jgi:hypothetical protein